VCSVEAANRNQKAAHTATPAPAGPLRRSLRVALSRAGSVESLHRVRAAVVDADGHLVAAWGDPVMPVFPRSAIKPLQVLPLLETGAYAAFGLDDRALALACASHSGEACHIDLASRWLAMLGLTPGALACGTHPPLDPAAAADLIRAGLTPSPLHNNCSGKHLAMLTTALHRGEPVRGYEHLHHPVQQRILGVLEQMTAQDLSEATVAIDGCSVPTLAVPLAALALAFARFAAPAGRLPDARVAAVETVWAALAAHPTLIGGRDVFDSRIMAASGGAVLVKRGAEGVSCAAVPRLGLGIALKVEDGAARARDPAMAAVLHHCGALTGLPESLVADWLEQPITNLAGVVVGRLAIEDGVRNGDSV